MLNCSVEKSSSSEHGHGKTHHDKNRIQVFEGCVRRFGESTKVVRGVHRLSPKGLTATEDEVQMFVRHVVLLVWVRSARRCWIATSEEEGIL